MFDDDAAYNALLTHDARFDGRVFVGVTSTGIYCRPVCRVRTPLRRNCRFFASAAGAEHDGFRPCLRCRPELAPGLALVDSPRVLALQAARMLAYAARAGEALTMPALGARLGVTDRHLRRIFAEAHGVSPLHYLATQRVLLAKQLLTDTALPVSQVALACGFDSLRRFNAAFAAHCRMSPTALRRGAADGASALTLRLPYRPPMDAAALLHFFAMRALPGVESVDGLSLRRTLALPDASGALQVGWLALQLRPEAAQVELQLAPTLLGALGRVVECVRHGLDLDADPALIEPALAGLPGTPGMNRGGLPGTLGTRVPGSFDGFETAVRIILGQQVTLAAARTLAQRLTARFGSDVETPWPDLNRRFPDAPTLAAATPESIGELGIVRQRVGAIRALAREVAGGRIVLHRGAPLAATQQALAALPGVGDWTVQMIALRVLAWPDAFAASDIGVLKGLKTRDPKMAALQAEAWRPWRSYALMRLWNSLET